ncbi:protein FRA10AC1 homolog isoform X2 [Ascaphus truei]|uniref:protein FRA10AC1 homolog isoform X2 n=1 Tax=Ascaphus truei TaxID=8439 RepID=UPI003F5A3761
MLAKSVHGFGGYDSDFSDEEADKQKNEDKKRAKKDEALFKKPFQKEKYGKVAPRQVATDEWDREEARNQRFHLISMDAFARHKKFVNDYMLFYGGKLEDFQRSKANDKTDLDVIRENHRFLWQEEDEEDMTWEKKLSKKYYDKLFKEYCIADLSKYKENKFGFRWRVEKEVFSGKGLCPECSYRLNFHHRRREVQPNVTKGQEEEGEPARKKSKISRSQKKKKSKDSSTDKQDDAGEKDTDDNEDDEGTSDADFWKGSNQETDEKSREEEFDEYFQDMFL